MRTLTEPRRRFFCPQPFAVPGHPKLVGQWEPGLETPSGCVQWKLHLSFAHSRSPGFSTINHSQKS